MQFDQPIAVLTWEIWNHHLLFSFDASVTHFSWFQQNIKHQCTPEGTLTELHSFLLSNLLKCGIYIWTMAAEFLKARVQPQMQLLRSSVEVPSIGKVLESNYPVNICNYIHMYVCVRARAHLWPCSLLTKIMLCPW